MQIIYSQSVSHLFQYLLPKQGIELLWKVIPSGLSPHCVTALNNVLCVLGTEGLIFDRVIYVCDSSCTVLQQSVSLWHPVMQ